MTVKIKDFKYERADMAAMEEYIRKATERVKAAKSAREVSDIRDEVNEYKKKMLTPPALTYVRHTQNVKDKFYCDEQAYYDENLPRIAAAGTDFDRAIVSSPYVEELEKMINPLILKNMRAEVLIMDERIVEDSIEENKLITEYDDLMSGLEYMWDGKPLTFSEIMKYAKDGDRSVRKRAYTVLGETLAGISDKLDDCFDRLVKVRTRMARKMGFSDFVEMGDIRTGHIGYGRKEIAVFRKSVLDDVVPALAELKAHLAKRLGLDSIHIYDNDNYINGGNVDPIGDSKYLFAAAQEMYDDMDPALGKFFREMCEAEAFDYESRNDKMNGGYADMLFGFNQPFILANFNGTMEDVGVLTHEFGHAYAFRRALDCGIDYELFVGGMETAETHSMGMESLCNAYADKFYGARYKDAIYQQIFDAYSFLPYGVIVDYFQELVYKDPDMTPEERKALWLRLESEFRPHVDMSDVPYINIGGRWQYQRHIYGVPFYYIDYCLSTCIALQLGEIAARDPKDAIKRYLEFVDKGGSKTIDTLAHEAGLMSPFDKGALKKLSKDVAAHIRSLE